MEINRYIKRIITKMIPLKIHIRVCVKRERFMKTREIIFIF